MNIVLILAICLFFFLFSKEEAKASEPPQSPKTDQELIAELLAKLLARDEQNVQK